MAYTPNQIAQLAYDAGFRGSALRLAVAVALAESSGNPNAYNPETAAGTRPGHGSRGLWQIYGTAHPWADNDQMFNPVSNAQAAFRVYKEAGNSFRPWSTFTNGSAHKIAQNLNLDIPTGQVDLTGGLGPSALAGAGGVATGVIGQPIAAGVVGSALGAGGTQAVASAVTGEPLVKISLLPENVQTVLSNIASDPEGIKKTITIVLLGGTFLVIGLIMLIAAMTPQSVKDLGKEGAVLALATAIPGVPPV